MFSNRMWIQAQPDRGQISTHDSIPHLTSARIDEKAKTRPITKVSYEFGMSQDSTSSNVDYERLTKKKKSYCPFTGATQLVCVLWKVTGSRGKNVFSGEPMLRPLNNILKRPLDSILKC